MFDFLQICLRKAKPVCKISHMFILADVWLLPNMFGKNQTRWYIYTWVLFSTHVWILTHRYGKRHTCVQKATQLYVCKCLAFSTHVWEKPLTCLFPPELWVHCWHCWYCWLEVALGCRASAIIYRKTRVYGDYQWIIAINASARPLTLQPNATPSIQSPSHPSTTSHFLLRNL